MGRVGLTARKRGARRPGPKKKAASEKQRQRIMLTLTDRERRELEQAAEGEALGTFVRRIVLRYLARRKGGPER